jgi:hypothetical protein
MRVVSRGSGLIGVRIVFVGVRLRLLPVFVRQFVDAMTLAGKEED